MSRLLIASAVFATQILASLGQSVALGSDSSSESSAGDYASCTDNFQTAKDACTNSTSTAGMSNSGAATMTTQLATVTTLVATASGSKAAAQACLISNGISAALGTINALKGDACSSSRSKCMNACKSYAEIAAQQLSESSSGFNSAFSDMSTVQKQKTSAESYYKSCNAYSAQVSNSLAQALTIAQNLAQAYSCYAALSSTTATATPIELTTASYDCSNSSYAATNLVCICQNDPTNSLCGTTTTATTSSTGSTTSTTTPSLATATDDETEVDTTPIGTTTTSGSNTAGNSSGGSGLSGSSGGTLGSTDGTASGDSGIDKNVITGTSGSASGLTGLGTGGSSGGGGKSVSANLGGGSGSVFDLKKYLPKSLIKNRGLAGMTVPSTDGITGPMGPSLWEKVTNRYQAVKSSLIQEK